MKNFSLIILFTAALSCSYAQERLFCYGEKADQICTDILGNVYTITHNEVNKYSSEKNIAQNFSNPVLGKISNIDVNIATKATIFHKESGFITILNNEFAPVGNSISLFDNGFYSIDLVGMISSDKIALYDDLNKRITITDLRLNILTTSNLNIPQDFHPYAMEIIPEHKIALIDTTNGICITDIFGTLERKLAIENIKSAILLKDCLIYLQQGAIFRLNFPSPTTNLEITKIYENDILRDAKDFAIKDEELLFIDKNGQIFTDKLHQPAHTPAIFQEPR